MKPTAKRHHPGNNSPSSTKKHKPATQLSLSSYLTSNSTPSTSTLPTHLDLTTPPPEHNKNAKSTSSAGKGTGKQPHHSGGGAGQASKKGKEKAKVPIVDDDQESDDMIILEETFVNASTIPTMTKPLRSIPTTSSAKPSSSVTASSKPLPPSPAKPPPQLHPTDIKPLSTFASANSRKLPPKGPSDRSLNTSVYAFEPQQDIDTAGWPGGRVPFAFLCDAFVIISATRSRIIIDRVLVNLLRTVIELDPDSLVDVIYLATGRLGPAHDGIELGIGPRVLSGAIKSVASVTPAVYRSLAIKHGDIGDVAFECRKSISHLIAPPPLVCHSVYSTLLEMAHLHGNGSIAGKTAKATKLLVAAQGEEIRFLARILAQNLRIGAVGKTIIKALARAFCLSQYPSRTDSTSDPFLISAVKRQELANMEDKKNRPKGKGKEPLEATGGEVDKQFASAETMTRKVWAVHPHYGHLIKALLSHGLKDLDKRLPLAIGTPVQSMLGTATRSLDDVYSRLLERPFVSEAKVDGQRIQIHVDVKLPEGDGGHGRWHTPDDASEQPFWARFFSKKHEDITEKYPDLFFTLSAILARSKETASPISNFIIDAEIAAINPIDGGVRPFQELSYRSRKDVEMGTIKIRVGVFAFDVLLLNGESLLAMPLRTRRQKLQAGFSNLEVPDPRWAKWQLVPSCEDTTRDKVEKFFAECVEMKMEGIMIKLLDELLAPTAALPTSVSDEPASPSKPARSRRKALPASYEPDVRGDSWLKLKKDYMENLGDSLDLVPLGAWHGDGRKSAWWSPILLGCYDSENGRWVAVCKCMSGFTDEFYKDLTSRYSIGGDKTSTTKYADVDAGDLRPAIWFEPSEVWEIRGADFTLSPVYTAAQGLVGERGISIRFPRFIRIRDPADKTPEDATTEHELAQLYRNQDEQRPAS